MERLVLPGFSPKNKEWVDQIAQSLEAKPIYWKHWTGEQDPDWIKKQAEEIVTQIGETQYDLVAKSVGTLVAMYVVRGLPNQLNKLILCGTPLNDLSNNDKKAYVILKDIDPTRVLCISNDEDPHGTFVQVEEFVHSINPSTQVVSKPGDHHDYYYFSEFKSFLSAL